MPAHIARAWACLPTGAETLVSAQKWESSAGFNQRNLHRLMDAEERGCLPPSIFDFHSLASFILVVFGTMAALRRENPMTERCLNFYHSDTPEFLTKWARRGAPLSACPTGGHGPWFLHSPQPAYCSPGEFPWLFSGSAHAHLPLLSPQGFCCFPAATILRGASVRGSCPLCVLLGGGAYIPGKLSTFSLSVTEQTLCQSLWWF